MRRLLATATLGAALVLVAGCTADSPDDTTAQSPGATAPADPGVSGGAQPGGSAESTTGPGTAAPAGGNAAEVCDAAVAASSTAATSYVQELGAMLRAGAQGDRAAADAAERKAQQAVDRWAAALTEQSGRATDPRLKAVLADLGREVGTLSADIESVDDAKLDGLQQRLDQLCGTS